VLAHPLDPAPGRLVVMRAGEGHFLKQFSYRRDS